MEKFYNELKAKKENFEINYIKIDENIKFTKFEKVIFFDLF